MPGAGAYLRGMAVACAAGTQTDDCLTALRAARASAGSVTLDGFAEPLHLPYYRINDGAALFDPARFERLLAPVVRAAVDEAGLDTRDAQSLPLFIGSSCFGIGASEAAYAEALARDPEQALPMPYCGYQDIADMAQRALDGNGDSYTFNTACTSSANALLAALRALASGRHRHALVIGAECANRTTLAGFAGMQLIAEALRPFDAARSGVVLSEGVGAVVVSSQPGKRADFVLRGGASNSDPYSVTTANPDGGSVAAVLRAALADAGIAADAVRGIKAHGTATPSGDTAEALGLRQVFERLPPITALKSRIGHTLGACGVIELVLYAQAVREGFLPATPGYTTPDPVLGIEPLTQAAEASRGCYLLNQFGFGGNNTVLVLEAT
ncbi:MAG TPA: beta-ketoacyl synthase N-terminal-like domain-containing protein [Gammaproteobacteria bacterium]|nr:beta-ketoacyl synthase N-terminal-like domain-containing protein [Gammaproteobacteria bacterium]